MFGATVIREMQIRATMRKHLVWLEWLLSERQVGPVHVAVEKRETVHTVDRNGGAAIVKRSKGSPKTEKQKLERWLGGYSAYCSSIRG